MPDFTNISIELPVLGFFRLIISDEFKHIFSLILFLWLPSVFIDASSCNFFYTCLWSNMLSLFVCLVLNVKPSSLSCFMEFIARCGLLMLSLLVIFALFSVRYDVLRRRGNCSALLTAESTIFSRVWYFVVLPCALLSVLVPPCRDQWLKGGMRVGSTMHWFLEASCF